MRDRLAQVEPVAGELDFVAGIGGEFNFLVGPVMVAGDEAEIEPLVDGNGQILRRNRAGLDDIGEQAAIGGDDPAVAGQRHLRLQPVNPHNIEPAGKRGAFIRRGGEHQRGFVDGAAIDQPREFAFAERFVLAHQSISPASRASGVRLASAVARSRTAEAIRAGSARLVKVTLRVIAATSSLSSLAASAAR